MCRGDAGEGDAGNENAERKQGAEVHDRTPGCGCRSVAAPGVGYCLARAEGGRRVAGRGERHATGPVYVRGTVGNVQELVREIQESGSEIQELVRDVQELVSEIQHRDSEATKAGK